METHSYAFLDKYEIYREIINIKDEISRCVNVASKETTFK